MKKRIPSPAGHPRYRREFRGSGPYGVLLTCALVVLTALLGPGSLSAGQEVTEDGVLHVKNGTQPAHGVETMELEEMWRIGGEDDEDVLLGIITRALIDDQDNIYLLDQQLSEVQVFNSDGEQIQTLGRQGTGPGEVNNPGDVVFMPDGTLGLVQVFPGKIVKLNMDGTPAGEFNPGSAVATEGGFLALVNCRSAGGNLVLSGVQISMDTSAGTQNRTFFMRSYDMEGAQLVKYFEKSVVWDFSSGFKFREIDNDFIWWRMDVGADGRLVVCEPRYEYALSVYAPDGTLERIIDREYESWPRNEQVMDRYDAIMEGNLAQFPPGTEKEVETVEQDVSDLRIARDGRIWVLPSRQTFEPEPGFFAVYDVFSPDGHFEKQVGVKCEGDPSVDRLMFAGENLVFQVTGFWEAVLGALGSSGGEDGDAEAEPMEIVCYRIVK